MKHTFEVELNFKVGTEFYDDSYRYRQNIKLHYKIIGIRIYYDFGNNIRIAYDIAEDLGYLDLYKKTIFWRKIDFKYSEEMLSKVLPKDPYIVKTELKYNKDDIVLTGVNGQIPSDIETYKDSYHFLGNVCQINTLSIIIDETKQNILYNANVLYSGWEGRIYTYDYPIMDVPEYYSSLLIYVDIDALINIICRKYSCKRNLYNPLYKDNKPIFDSRNDFVNKYAGLFRFLMVEEIAMDIYYRYLKMREEGKKTIYPKKKNKKLKQTIYTIIYIIKEKLK